VALIDNNPFDEVRTAVNQARELFRAADDQANNMAALLEGRLRKVNPYWLKRLKKELHDFNAATGKWKEH
jgi:hypothetical protein